MRTLAAWLVVVAVVGCRSSKGQPTVTDAAPVASASSTAAVDATAPARFSRPVAAAAAGGATLVAGLVVPRGVIAMTALGPDGATRWTRDVIPGVAWSGNSALSVLRSKTGAVVVWRGLRGGQVQTVAVAVEVDGKIEGELFPVGAAACTTMDELAWVEHSPTGSWLVKTQPFGTATATLALTLPEDRDPALLCAAHTGFGFAEGEDDVLMGSWRPATHGLPLRVIQDSDFKADEERGHELYTVGDVLGVVRVGSGGSVAAREVTQGHPTSWRRLTHKLAEGDDVALVDADAHAAVLAFSHDASAAGNDVTGQSSVQAIVWEREGGREVGYQVAPPDAGRVRGPFWSGAVTGGVVVGWVERGGRADGGGAPISAMAYRLLSLDSLGESHRVERPADDLVDAGCDDVRCYAVALARGAGEDGGQPEVVQVIAYP
jgi:hypothetical protein